MNGFRKAEGHATATFVAERECIAFSHYRVMRQAMLIVNNAIQTGLRDLLAGAVRLLIGLFVASRWKQLLHSGWLDERQVNIVVADK